MLIHRLQLLAGVIALSTAVIWIKASATHPVALAAIRLTLAALLLTPLERRERRRHAVALAAAGPPPRTWIPGAVLALHFISWAYGARLAVAAQASLIVNLVPVAMPFFLWAIADEKINRREVFGTLIVIAGLAVLSFRDALASDASVLGNVVCFGSMLLFGVYLALSRRNRGVPSLWLYVVPVYRHAAIVAVVAALPWLADGVPWTSPREWGILLGLTILPTMVGHSLLNRGMRHFRGQVVSLTNCSQFIYAGTMAFFFFGEIPSATFFFAATLVAIGIVIVIRATPKAT
ncbi:DMT family transporter [Synoicihabitans lomoniglobus]|uniref:DMT family transporter n=1 Tax=Synoicihabitans lomoniglobus TaxID=2909285 RepID=A0AAE9ZU63_9BACT|nr:DMT family transporter [Opitutaceae bacterium LMO-M01]WED65220.1 DMT family transporter [Opitutaceae bacterium LMO-M01]